MYTFFVLLKIVGIIVSLVVLFVSFCTISETWKGAAANDTEYLKDFRNPLFWKVHGAAWMLALTVLIICVLRLLR